MKVIQYTVLSITLSIFIVNNLLAEHESEVGRFKVPTDQLTIGNECGKLPHLHGSIEGIPDPGGPCGHGVGTALGHTPGLGSQLINIKKNPEKSTPEQTYWDVGWQDFTLADALYVYFGGATSTRRPMETPDYLKSEISRLREAIDRFEKGLNNPNITPSEIKDFKGEIKRLTKEIKDKEDKLNKWNREISSSTTSRTTSPQVDGAKTTGPIDTELVEMQLTGTIGTERVQVSPAGGIVNVPLSTKLRRDLVEYEEKLRVAIENNNERKIRKNRARIQRTKNALNQLTPIAKTDSNNASIPSLTR